MNICDALKELSNYPVPHRVIEKACIKGGISLYESYESGTETNQGYMVAKAHVLRWLSTASPTVSELGVSFSLSESEKRAFKAEADKIEGTKSAFGILYQ